MTKDLEWYLSHGFDRPMAEYYASGERRKIIAVKALEDFSLMMEFDNGERRILDCKPFLKPHTVFEPFMDYRNFSRVYLDDTHAVCWDIDPCVNSETVWNNKVDISPESCYVDSVRCDERSN